jgi:hypothetical protein
MIFTELETYESFINTYGNRAGGVTALFNFGLDLEKWTHEKLSQFIFTAYGQYPSTSKKVMIRGIKRIVQAKFYKDIYGNNPPDSVKEADEKVKMSLGLHSNGTHKEEVRDMPTVKKTKQPKNEFSAKISTMSIDQIIEWARQVGVAEDKICKHKDKPVGLAKMNLGNLIRNKTTSSQVTS